MKYSLLFHCNYGCTDAPHCYVTCNCLSCKSAVYWTVHHCDNWRIEPNYMSLATFIFLLEIQHVYWTVHHCDSWRIKPNYMSLATFIFFLETQYVSSINMPIFRILRLCCSTTTLSVTFFVCCVLEWGCGSAIPDTSLAEPHPKSSTQQTKNGTNNVAVQQHSRKLLKMGILMLETCWVSKKKIKVASGIYLCFIFQL